MFSSLKICSREYDCCAVCPRIIHKYTSIRPLNSGRDTYNVRTLHSSLTICAAANNTNTHWQTLIISIPICTVSHGRHMIYKLIIILSFIRYLEWWRWSLLIRSHIRRAYIFIKYTDPIDRKAKSRKVNDTHFYPHFKASHSQLVNRVLQQSSKIKRNRAKKKWLKNHPGRVNYFMFSIPIYITNKRRRKKTDISDTATINNNEKPKTKKVSPLNLYYTYHIIRTLV